MAAAVYLVNIYSKNIFCALSEISYVKAAHFAG